MKKSNLFLHVILILSLLVPCALLAKEPSIFDEMNYQELLEVDLEMDLAAIFSDRRNSEKHKAIFSFKNKKGTTQNWNIKVAQRGKFRRSKCENLPPIKLYFNKKELEKAGFATFDDLKLVTHCVNDFELAKKLLVKEYLAYKMYNQLTEESFRVQFLKINYKDTVSGKVVSQFAIVIEDLGELRNRVGAKNKKETEAVDSISYDTSRLQLVTYFQYMIGNSDWSVKALRNVKVLLNNEKGFLVPYDFDFASMVNAPYAIKHESQKKIQRIYRGSKEDAKNLMPVLFIFLVKKDEFLRTIKRCRLMKRKDRKEVIRFIRAFYENIGEINVPSSLIEE